jgi:hypothetical protein
MNAQQRKLITAIRDYAQNTLDGVCAEDEGCGILSGLVNLVDSATEKSLELPRSQSEREIVLVNFLLSHDNNNEYDYGNYENNSTSRNLGNF